MNGFVRLNPLLNKQYQSGQLSHAYIFTGDGAVPQAFSLAAQLNCRKPEQGRPCGACLVCENILAGTYPDCRLIELDRGSHRIEGMRAMGVQAQLAAMADGWKIFILPDAERMSDEAANILLKLLEEPPEQTIFILISQQPEKLLPTILSRCQIFALGNGLVNKHVQAAPEMIREAEAFLQDLPTMPIYEVLLKARQWEKREDQQGFLLALLFVLHNASCGRAVMPMSYPYLLRSETMVESALELIENNINQKILMDVVYLRLWQNCGC